MCTIISNFDFDPLRVEIGPYGALFDETTSKNNCHVRNWLIFNRNETISYAIHQHPEKRIDINCKHGKVTFGFKYIWRYQIRCRVIIARALEFVIYCRKLDIITQRRFSLADVWSYIADKACR